MRTWYDTNMGPVENMTEGYLLPKETCQAGNAFSICSRKGCAAAATMKSLEKPTGFVCNVSHTAIDRLFQALR